MLIDFFLHLKASKLPVSTKESFLEQLRRLAEVVASTINAIALQGSRTASFESIAPEGNAHAALAACRREIAD